MSDIISKTDQEKKVQRLLIEAVRLYLDNNPERAFEKTEAARNLDSEEPTARFFSVYLIDKYGYRSKIEKTKISPQDMEGVIAIKLYQAVRYFHKGEYDTVVKLCEEVIELDPKEVTAYIRIGSAYYALGVKSQAMKYWKKALEVSPGNKEVLEFLEKISSGKQ